MKKLLKKMVDTVWIINKQPPKAVNVDETTAKLLESLKTACESQRTMFLYWYVKELTDYYATCFVADSTRIRIDMCVQLTDYGDEVFNTVWTVGKELFGPKYPINDRLTMRIEGDREKGRIDPNCNPVFEHTGSNADKLHIVWDIDLAEIKL